MRNNHILVLGSSVTTIGCICLIIISSPTEAFFSYNHHHHDYSYSSIRNIKVGGIGNSIPKIKDRMSKKYDIFLSTNNNNSNNNSNCNNNNISKANKPFNHENKEYNTSSSLSSSSRITTTTSSSIGLEAPDVKKIIYFAIPAIGIWLCGPILSLIDTSAVGLLSGTAQQAALNPAITITEDGALLVSFMYTATTNLVAAAFENDRNNQENNSQTITTFIASLKLALLVGILFCIGLGTCSTFLLKSLIGRNIQHGQNEMINIQVLAAAEKYIRIRAIGMPAAVIIGAAQAACLGMKDIRSPLVVMVAAAFVNLIGDIVLVPCTSSWLGGAAGAAWATVISQYAALFMFMKWLRSKPKSQPSTTSSNSSSGGNTVSGNMEQNQKSPEEGELKEKNIITNITHDIRIEEENQDSFETKHKQEQFSTRGILHGNFRYRDLFNISSFYNQTTKKFLPYVIPVTTTAIGRVSGYIAMSHVVSSALGTIDLAAQQIVLAFFLCFIPMCDSLNLTAQSFVPGIFEYKGAGTHDDRKLRSTVMKKTVSNFLKAGSIFGLVLMGVVSCIPLVSRFFSHDPNVISSVNSTTLYLSCYAILSGIVCAGEGLLLGQKDLKFLSNSFTAFFFIVPYLLLRLKHAVLRGAEGIGLSTVWRVFTFYQAVRCILWLLRIKFLSKKMERETMNMATTLKL